MKSVLVTGGAGYIGSHTVSELKKNGFIPVVVDNLSNGFWESLPIDVQFYHLDVRNKKELATVFATHKFWAVIHLAGLAVVAESFQKEPEYLEHNYKGTQVILDLCRNFGVKNFMFSSSSTIYGNVNGMQKLTEKHNISPVSPYGRSKVLCEEKIIEMAKASRDFNYFILRYFNVAGASSDLKNGQRGYGQQRIFFNACKAAIKNLPFVIHGNDYSTEDGTCVRDYIHVEDIADIHVSALKHLEEASSQNHKVQKTLNCGYGVGFSVAQIVEKFKKTNEVDFVVQQGPRRQGDPEYLVGDNSELVSLLGWRSRFADPLEAICRSAYRWEFSRKK